MSLKELKLGKAVKCTCDLCRGTGLNRPNINEAKIGFICSNCNGRGYTILNLEDNLDLFQDSASGAIYLVKDAMIEKRVELFNGLEIRSGIDYVTYLPNRGQQLEDLEATSIIPYERFVSGEYPLPNEKDNCPRKFTSLYGSHVFENGCTTEDCKKCKKYESGDCWDAFYGNAITPDELQHVLRKVKD